MASYEDRAEVQHLIRRYSRVVKVTMPTEPLAQGLAKKVDYDIELERSRNMFLREAEKTLFGGDENDPQLLKMSDALGDLESKTEELERSWQKFQSKVPLPDGEKLEAQHDKSKRFDLLKSSVVQAQDSWKRKQTTRPGKVKQLFTRVVQSLDDHNYLFAMLPSGDRYTSVFTGAFSALVRGTITHEEIALDISNSFDQISDHVRSFYIATRRHPESHYIKRHICLFYCTLFTFFTRLLLDWYSSWLKRLSRSLGSSFLENLNAALDELSRYTTRVKEEAAVQNSIKTEKMLMLLGGLMQECLTTNAVTHEYLKELPEQIRTQISDHFESRIKANRRMSMAALPAPAPSSAKGAQYEDSTPGTAGRIEEVCWTRESVQVAAQYLERYLQDSEISRWIDQASNLSINGDVFIRLHLWASRNSSEALWVEGPPSSEQPSQNTLTSAFILGSIRLMNIPVIAHFCQYDASRWQTWNPAEELLKLVCSLIYQASRILPRTASDNEPHHDFSSSRFNKLDNIEALSEAIKLLADLISAGPPLLFCIVDDFQILDQYDSTTELKTHLQEFVNVICEAVKTTTSEEIIIKILFTTDGFCRMLRDAENAELLVSEIYDHEKDDELLTLNANNVWSRNKSEKDDKK